MNDDPTEVKVLFAQVTHNEKLQELVDKVADYFVNAGKYIIYIYREPDRAVHEPLMRKFSSLN